MNAEIDAIRSRIATEESIDWNEVLREILDAFDCTTGTLHFWDHDKQRLMIEACQGIPNFLLPRMSEIPIGKGMAGIAAERREPVQVCNLQTDASGVARPSAKDTKMEGSLASPMMHEGKLYGTLGIAKPVPYDFTDAEVAALLSIADTICERLARTGQVQPA